MEEHTQTRLFGALESAFRDVPPSRIAGAIMVTDGEVHDVPVLRIRLQCAAACAGHRRGGREGPPHPHRARAALRHRRQAARHGLSGHRLGRRNRSRRCPHQHQRQPRLDGAGGDRPREAAAAHHSGRRQQHRRAVDRPPRWRIDRRQQPRHRAGRRHPRKSARAAGIRRAACRRAHLAQPVEVRRLRRPRAFHHPAAAGEAGRHADQRIVADRLSDARAVRREDQRFRPDHLRPLPAPRRAADPLLRLHLGICGEGRRAADRRRPRICRRNRRSPRRR